MSKSMDRPLALFLKTIDFFLSPANLVSIQSRMRARTVVFIFLFWAFLDTVGFFSALSTQQPAAWINGSLILLNLTFALLIKKSFAPEKVFFAYSGLFVIFQHLAVAIIKDVEPSSFAISIVFIFINCLITSDIKQRLAFMTLILAANGLAFLLLYEADSRHIWSFSGDLFGSVQFLVLSVISYLITISMFSKIKAIAQSDLDLEIFWQERATRLEDCTATTKVMGELLAGPINAIHRDLKQFQRDPNQIEMDDLQKQLDELLSISKAVDWIYRKQRGEDSLFMLSAQQEKMINELLVKIKAP